MSYSFNQPVGELFEAQTPNLEIQAHISEAPNCSESENIADVFEDSINEYYLFFLNSQNSLDWLKLKLEKVNAHFKRKYPDGFNEIKLTNEVIAGEIPSSE